MISRKKNHLGGSSVCTDCIDGLLHSGSPCIHIEVMGLVHETKNDVWLIGIPLSKLGPEVSKLIIRGTTLANDASIPTSVVVDIEDTFSSRVEAGLHHLVEPAKEAFVHWAAGFIVD